MILSGGGIHAVPDSRDYSCASLDDVPLTAMGITKNPILFSFKSFKQQVETCFNWERLLVYSSCILCGCKEYISSKTNIRLWGKSGTKIINNALNGGANWRG